MGYGLGPCPPPAGGVSILSAGRARGRRGRARGIGARAEPQGQAGEVCPQTESETRRRQAAAGSRATHMYVPMCHDSSFKSMMAEWAIRQTPYPSAAVWSIRQYVLVVRVLWFISQRTNLVTYPLRQMQIPKRSKTRAKKHTNMPALYPKHAIHGVRLHSELSRHTDLSHSHTAPVSSPGYRSTVHTRVHTQS